MPRSKTENDPQTSKRQTHSLLLILIIFDFQKIIDSCASAQKWQIQFLYSCSHNQSQHHSQGSGSDAVCICPAHTNFIPTATSS